MGRVFLLDHLKGKGPLERLRRRREDNHIIKKIYAKDILLKHWFSDTSPPYTRPYASFCIPYNTNLTSVNDV